MARYALIFAALLALPAACDLSLEEGDSDRPPGEPPTFSPPGFLYNPSVAGTAGAGGADSSGSGLRCAANADCPQGEDCEGYACVDLPPACSRPGVDCPQSGECHKTCIARAPARPGTTPDTTPPSWVSQGGAGGSSNASASSCPLPDAGLANGGSAAGGGACDRAAVCLTNDECGDGLCVNNRCQGFCVVSSDCRADEACVLGLCRADAADLECIDASNCATSDDCVGGRCLRRCFTSEHCAGCDDGLVCRTGYCGP